MKTIELTIEQYAVIAEALELAAQLACKMQDEEAFVRFQMTDLIYEKVPELVGTDCSKEYKRLSEELK